MATKEIGITADMTRKEAEELEAMKYNKDHVYLRANKIVDHAKIICQEKGLPRACAASIARLLVDLGCK